MRIARPYIPLSIRVQVAERQLCSQGDWRGPLAVAIADNTGESYGRRLKNALRLLFGASKVELHHRPALVNRPWNKRRKDYDPPANSPDHLVYLAEDDHDIETRVRGVGAQRSDLSQRRYLKKVARNRQKRTSVPRAKVRGPKRKWPSRKIANRRKA